MRNLFTRRGVDEGGHRVETACSKGLEDRLEDALLQRRQFVAAQINGRSVGEVHCELRIERIK